MDLQLALTYILAGASFLAGYLASEYKHALKEHRALRKEGKK